MRWASHTRHNSLSLSTPDSPKVAPNRTPSNGPGLLGPGLQGRHTALLGSWPLQGMQGDSSSGASPDKGTLAAETALGSTDELESSLSSSSSSGSAASSGSAGPKCQPKPPTNSLQSTQTPLRASRSRGSPQPPGQRPGNLFRQAWASQHRREAKDALNRCAVHVGMAHPQCSQGSTGP